MALSSALIEATSASVTSPGTSVAPTITPKDNTHTLVILNPSTTATVLVGFGTAGAALPQASSVNVLPNTSLSLSIGTLSQRASAGTDIIFDGTGAVDVRIFYVNGTTS
jgi:hypothetical protein